MNDKNGFPQAAYITVDDVIEFSKIIPLEKWLEPDAPALASQLNRDVADYYTACSVTFMRSKNQYVVKKYKDDVNRLRKKLKLVASILEDEDFRTSTVMCCDLGLMGGGGGEGSRGYRPWVLSPDIEAHLPVRHHGFGVCTGGLSILQERAADLKILLTLYDKIAQDLKEGRYDEIPKLSTMYDERLTAEKWLIHDRLVNTHRIFISIKPSASRCRITGEPSGTCVDFCDFLLKKIGKPLSRETILDAIYGRQSSRLVARKEKS
ncbi:MAG TPA: hypothetical protein VEF76_03505 [Patescibacteria group bacterium]|nr:hypothetical protein [Patescibacteria group bacterium]